MRLIQCFTGIATSLMFLMITPAMFSAQTDKNAQGVVAESQAQQIALLLTQLGDANYHVRRKAVFALAQIGSPAVPALIQALSHQNRSVRFSAAETLGQIGAAGQMGQHQKDAVSALKQALGDEDWLVRQRAKESLKQIDPSFVMKATPPTISDSNRQTTPTLPSAAAQQRQDLGTGFIVDSRGYILTAAHVVNPPETVFVTVGNQSYQATVQAVDVQHDLALLKISATGLPTVRIGDANAVERQDPVWVLGFPLTQQLGTVLNTTAGHVTAIQIREKLFQFDAAVNPGNSGGPLVNHRGEVVGIVQSKWIAQQGGRTVSEGVNFAMPMSFAFSLLAQIPDVDFSTLGRATKELSGHEIDALISPAVVLISRVFFAEVQSVTKLDPYLFITVSINDSTIQEIPLGDQSTAEIRLKDGRSLPVAYFITGNAPYPGAFNSTAAMWKTSPGGTSTMRRTQHPPYIEYIAGRGLQVTIVNLNYAPLFRGTYLLDQGGIRLEMLFEAPDAQEGDVESVRVLELPPLPVPSHAIVPFRFPSNAMIFLNGSSQPVFVRIIGPTRNRFWVSSGEALGVHVAPGEYDVKLRYGAPEIGPQPGMEPHQYTYFRGESFAIEEGSSPPSSQPNIILDPIPGTLRINPGGELKTTPISPEEFEHD